MRNWAVTKILAQELLYGTIYDPIYWELLQHMMGIIFKQSSFRVCMALQRVFFYIRWGLPQDWPHKQIVRSWVQIHVVNCCIWNHVVPVGLKHMQDRNCGWNLRFRWRVALWRNTFPWHSQRLPYVDMFFKCMFKNNNNNNNKPTIYCIC